MTTTLSPAKNHWVEPKCAKAFWGQRDLPAYGRLLADTVAAADPRPGDHWLDLGCGGGSISRAIWERTAGRVGSVLGVDCAAANADRYSELRRELGVSDPDRFRFDCHDFSGGLGAFADASFDHAVSGLSISYAESRDPVTGEWDQSGYDRVLAEVYRILRPGGRFVFSVNVPEPSWLFVGLCSLGGVFATKRPLQFLKRVWRMSRYGRWLKHEARRGRFHYLTHDVISEKLRRAGYADVSHTLSYAGQAYVFRATKPIYGVER